MIGRRTGSKTISSLISSLASVNGSGCSFKFTPQPVRGRTWTSFKRWSNGVEMSCSNGNP